MHELERLFRPRSVAVIGASSDPSKLGGRVLHNLATLGYGGRIHPVHPAAAAVQGLPAHRDVAGIEGEVDQAVIILPAPAVEAALEACAAKGIRVAQVLSSGFAEAGGDGPAMQARLVAIARRAGMRITGPNALGSISPPDGFFATFSSLLSSARPGPGTIGVATQSGAFGSHIYAAAMLRGLGISRAVATGNEADIDVAACIDYLAEDPGTSVILAALEGCRDGNALRRALLKAAAVRKPVILMKVGSSEAGAAAAATHTGALAGEDRVFDAVFRECGAWRARSIEEMVDIAHLLTVGRAPPSAEVGIVTISGGIGVLMADACIRAGLSVPALPEPVLARIRDALPDAGGRNPIDTTANAGGRLPVFGPVTEAVLEGGAGTVLLYLSHLGRDPARFAPMWAVLEELRTRHPDRLLVVVMTAVDEVRARLDAIGVPLFEDPTRAVEAVAAAALLRGRQAEAEPLPDVPPAAPLTLRSGNEAEAKALLARIGIPVLPERACRTAAEARRAADALGYPVALKILSDDIAHKTEVGGVALDLGDGDAVEHAFAAVIARARAARPEARLDGALVAPMARGGVETVLGARRDPIFGPMVMFGLGGVSVELFQDVAFASAPLTRERARRLIAAVRGARLLDGWRGAPALDREVVVDALCRLSELAAAQEGVLDAVEINPFLVRTDGAVALDGLLVRRAG